MCRLERLSITRHFASRFEVRRHPAIESGSIHHVCCTEQRTPRSESIKAALPWVGMGLCLAAFLSYVAYDRLLAPGRRLLPRKPSRLTPPRN